MNIVNIDEVWEDFEKELMREYPLFDEQVILDEVNTDNELWSEYLRIKRFLYDRFGHIESQAYDRVMHKVLTMLGA